MIDIDRAAHTLKHRDNILILAHASPDGDTLGGGYALFRGLAALGKRVRLTCGDTASPRFAFLREGLPVFDPLDSGSAGESEQIEHAGRVGDESFIPEYIVATDIADEVLLGDLQPLYGGKIDLCIDHHSSNTFFAKETLLLSAAANAENIFLLLKAMGVEITEKIAEALYIGIITDTGCFKYSNTTAQTHRITAELMETGIDYARFNSLLFELKTQACLKMESGFLRGMRYFAKGKAALGVLDKETIASVDPEDINVISAIPRSIEGVMLGITLKQQKTGDKWKVSLRSNAPVDAAAFAKKFGGGGHNRAAGCVLAGENAEDIIPQLLPLIEELFA
jgi:phosphoesterase RecJ-like protein